MESKHTSKPKNLLSRHNSRKHGIAVQELLTDETKHTPGPWYVACGMVWKDENTPIACPERFTKNTSPVERDANARLIAAAPELLEACELAYRNLFPKYPSDHLVMKLLKAAILKATGSVYDPKGK